MIARFLVTVDCVSRAGAALAFISICGIAVLILSEIAARTLFNVSLSFAWEYSTYFMAVGIFCGAAYTMRTGGQVRVWLVSANLSPRATHGIEVVCTVLGIGIAGFVAYALIQLAALSFFQGSRAATMTEIPLVIPQGGVAIGAAMLLLQLVARLVRLVIGEATETAGPGEGMGGHP